MPSPRSPMWRCRGPRARHAPRRRTAINFLQLLSGGPTVPAGTGGAIDGNARPHLRHAQTIPGCHRAEVRGALRGARNHRIGLYEASSSEDNTSSTPGSLTLAVHQALCRAREHDVCVGGATHLTAREGSPAGARLVLLTISDREDARRPWAVAGGSSRTEASGGITLENVRAIAENRALHRISIGSPPRREGARPVSSLSRTTERGTMPIAARRLPSASPPVRAFRLRHDDGGTARITGDLNANLRLTDAFDTPCSIPSPTST